MGKQLFPKTSRHKALEFVPETSTTALAAKPKEKEPLLLQNNPASRLGTCSTASLVVGDIFSTASDIERKAAVRGLVTYRLCWCCFNVVADWWYRSSKTRGEGCWRPSCGYVTNTCHQCVVLESVVTFHVVHVIAHL